MWGFGNSAGLLQMHSFAEVKNKWDATAPIRGRTVECRPLGRNRARSDYELKKHWRVIEDGCLGQYMESYTARLWNTDYVEWFSNGNLFVRTGGYSSPSTNAIINYSVADTYGQLYSCNGKPYFKTKDGKSYLLTNDGLMLEPTGEQVQVNAGMAKVMHPLNPIQEYKYRANRKAMNAVRKRYKKFIDYGIAMFSIDDQLPEREKKGSWYDYALTYSKWNNDEMKKNRAKVFKLIDGYIDTDNLELAYQASVEIGHGFGSHGFGHRCTVDDFIDGMNEIFKYCFKDEVFAKEVIEVGTPFYDRNAKYFL
jgi:hypothetical protein